MTVRGDLFLGLDVGTQGTKGLLVDAGTGNEGGVVARAETGYGLIEGLPAGAAEQHPDTWVSAIRSVMAKLGDAADLSRVRGVGVSGQQHGFVPLDGDGEVIRPAKLWCDTATSAEARELSDALGRSVPTGFTASKILWLKRHEPEAFARLRHVMLPHDFINYRLTGERTMEPGDASGTGFFDFAKRQFDARAMAAIDPHLSEMLPALVQPGELAGRVDSNGAEWLGVPEGTPVSSGGGDNMMSAIGSGAVSAGVVVLSLGTSGTVFTHMDRAPDTDAEGLIAPFCGSAGGWLPLLCVMNLTGVTEEVRLASGLDHDRLTALASDVPAGCDGLMWMPFLQGERVPDLPDATGTLTGMRAGCLQPGVLYRAAIEGTTLNLAWGMERMRRMGIELRELRLVGGASRNPLWRQVLADVCQVEVRALEERESAALGAALQAMWATRRLAGKGADQDDDAAIGSVIEPFVRWAEEVSVQPGPQSVSAGGVYRELRERYGAALSNYYAPRP